MDNFIESSIRKIVLEEIEKFQMTQKEPARAESAIKEEKLLTTTEASEFLRISRITLHRWKKEGIIPHVRIGDTIRYKKSDLETFTKSR